MELHSVGRSCSNFTTEVESMGSACRLVGMARLTSTIRIDIDDIKCGFRNPFRKAGDLDFGAWLDDIPEEAAQGLPAMLVHHRKTKLTSMSCKTDFHCQLKIQLLST